MIVLSKYVFCCFVSMNSRLFFKETVCSFANINWSTFCILIRILLFLQTFKLNSLASEDETRLNNGRFHLCILSLVREASSWVFCELVCWWYAFICQLFLWGGVVLFSLTEWLLECPFWYLLRQQESACFTTGGLGGGPGVGTLRYTYFKLIPRIPNVVLPCLLS